MNPQAQERIEALLKKQPRELPLLLTPEACAGRTYIVTGANTGLGFEAAKTLVSLGSAKVIMGCRNTAAGEAAKAEIEAATNTSGIAEMWEVDLASYDSVKQFAKKAMQLERIDALIENAGLAQTSFSQAEGHLTSLTVNVYSTFLLAILLLPKMRKDADKFGILPHIVIVSSEASLGFQEGWEKIKNDPLNNIDGLQGPLLMASYPFTKLCEILAVRYLGQLLPVDRSKVVINATSPGLCKTNLSRNAPQQFRDKIAMDQELYGRTAETGSRTLLFGAIAGKKSHGLHLEACKINDPDVPDWVKGDESSQKLVWDAIVKELDTIEPGCVSKVL